MTAAAQWSRRATGWWHLLALATMVEIEVRRRPSEHSLEGGVDWWIWIELGLFVALGTRMLVRFPTARLHNAISISIAGYCASSALSAITASTTALASARAGQLLVVLAGTLEFERQLAAHGHEVVHRWLHGFVAVTTTLITIGLVERLANPARRSERFSWLLTHSVLAGAVIALSVVVLFGMWLAHPTINLPWSRAAYLALFALHVTTLLLTRTRGSIAAAGAAVAMMSLWWFAARRGDLLTMLTLALIGFGLTTAGPIIEYLTRSASAGELSTLNSRTGIWHLAWRMIGERPLMGHGLTTSRGAFLAETGLGGAHNAYLNVLVDVGLIGFGWWSLVIVLTVTRLRLLARRCAPQTRTGRSGPVAFCTVTVGGLTICQLTNALTAEWLGVGVSTSAVVLFITALWVHTIARTRS